MDITISVLTSKEIDVYKWNTLVKAYKAPIYAHYHYINTLCKKWKALVINDYELVLPIPYKTKLGIPYSYSVPFIQQLGFIGNIELIKDFSAITKAIKKVAKLGEIYANHNNQFLLNEQINVVEKLNLILPLQKTYQQLQENFSKDALRNIAKAEKQNFEYSLNTGISVCVQLYKTNYASKMKNIINRDYENFEKLCQDFVNDKQCISRSVLLDGVIVACTILFKDDYRLYNVANTTTTKGKTLSANYFLFRSLIQEFASSGLIVDFEGSEIPGVRKFYEGFGAIPKPYFMWKFNFLKF